MLKKYYLALLLLIFSCNAAASIWSDIGGCLSNPCNCGQGDRTEIWNAGTVNEVKKTFKPGSLCPPWNKSDGRDEDTCLLQYDHPDTFIGFYLKRCAEATASSSYFSPKIRIRIQSCNAAACWSQSSTLNWDGECVLWPTGYGLPLTRICARVAIPETPPPPGLNTQGNPADPGYTVGKHLNEVGYVENDEPIIGVDGAVITLQPPKLCAYSDPGLVNLVSNSGVNTNAMDWNPNSQPLHKTTELSPIAKVLKFLVDTVGGANLPNLLGSLLDMMGAENSEILKVFKTVFKAIGEIFKFFPSLIIKVIEVFGSLNSVVDNYSFGCVQLPFGPYPPPFCPSLNELTVSPLLHNICSQKNPDSIIFNQSSAISPCVVSNVANNVINNAVRVSFNNLVPLCSGASPDLTTCIELKNIEPFSSATGAHIATSYTDLIKACSSATADAPCVNTAIPLSCSVTANGCNQGFRIVYSQKMGTSSTPSDYYISDLPDCGTAANNSTTCQEIWGVNIGEFIDISVKFPMVQNQTDLTPLQQTFSLKDNNNKARNFYASIVNKATAQQSPADICVFESASLVDCQARVDKGYSLVTYKCGEHAGLNCPNNTYYTPQFIASMQVRDDSNNILAETNSIVTPLSLTGSPNSTAIEVIITLAGYDFSSSVAYIPAIPPKSPADKYIAMPFSGPNSLNQSTIYGTYKNNETPYDASGQVNPNAVYLKYLEYINGKYIQGGTHACLMPKDFQHCVPMIPPQNPNIPTPPQNTQINCTLAKLTESDTVDCQTFKDKSILYPNLGICQGDISSCTQKEVVAGNGITIYSCGITNCYTNNDKANTPVCVLSRDYQNRIDPAPDKGPILTDSQYYAVKYDENNNYIVHDASGSDRTYKLAIADVRDKTSQELNLCVPILGTCSAITTPSNDSGNATWPETDVGDLAKGTCQPNWITIDPNKPLERYCLSNFDSKTVAFEKLAPDVGCRESKGITIEAPDSNFPENIDSSNQYDDSSKIGSFTLNKEPQNNGAFPEDVIITQGLYHAVYEFEIDSVIDDIEYFQIKKVAYDDCVLIKINDQKVLSEPTDVNDFNLNTCNGGKDQGNVRFTTNVPIDVKSKLKQGKNTISFQLGVIGKGGLYYYMEYKMHR